MMTHSTVGQSWASFLRRRPIQQGDDASTQAAHAGRCVLLTGHGCILVPKLGSPNRIVDLARYMFARQGEIPLVLTGLRAGEKMAEETTSSCEIVHPNAERELDRVDHTTDSQFDPGNSIRA